MGIHDYSKATDTLPVQTSHMNGSIRRSTARRDGMAPLGDTQCSDGTTPLSCTNELAV